LRFLALYSGSTISDAELVAISADRKIISDFGKRLVSDEPELGPGDGPVNDATPHQEVERDEMGRRPI
jgi:hypothetical protein